MLRNDSTSNVFSFFFSFAWGAEGSAKTDSMVLGGTEGA